GDTFDALLKHARASLASYVHEADSRIVLSIEEEFKASQGEVVLSGRVDALFEGTGGECIVDFKTTGTIDKKKKEEYESQLAFYDHLLRENGRNPVEGLIIQIGEDKVVEHAFPLTPELREAFKDNLTAVIAELENGKWRAGEPSEYDGLLTLFK
ncbi:MAG TPA: PD-(D/E)XK nuclease family protein, partial [Candidatus Paceibacterota bacterium]|nr:PD-(D/E)XK nuclease family protein [Candidatus Paceibacterota bacterium]